jgi:IS30 family transposase
VLSVDDWAEIRRLHRAEGLSIRAIARIRGVSRNTVRNAVRADGPPRYQRCAAGSVVDGAELRIRELLQAYPRMPATVIAERIDWPYSIRTLSGKVAELRPLYLPPDPAGRTVYLAGEIAQHGHHRPAPTSPCSARSPAPGRSARSASAPSGAAAGSRPNPPRSAPASSPARLQPGSRGSWSIFGCRAVISIQLPTTWVTTAVLLTLRARPRRE